MAFQDNVKVVVSAGEECFVCEKPIRSRGIAVQVSFRIPLVITSTTVERQMHLVCAEALRDTLDERIDEGRREESS